MRILIAFIVLFSFDARAKDCFLWSIKGTVIYEKPDYLLLSAQDTLSETKLTLPLEEQSKLMVFLNHAVEAKVLLAHNDVPRKGKILKVEGAERIVPDPLNENKATLFKKLGTRSCK